MCKNSRGFTLIEFLVAVVILMVGLLGLLQAVNLALNTNQQDQMRNEAITVADQELSGQLAKGFERISTVEKKTNVQRKVLMGYKNFSVARTVTEFSNTKKIAVQVKWTHKNTAYSHDASGAVSRHE